MGEYAAQCYFLRSRRFTVESVINRFRWQIGDRSNEMVKIAHAQLNLPRGPRVCPWLCGKKRPGVLCSPGGSRGRFRERRMVPSMVNAGLIAR